MLGLGKAKKIAGTIIQVSQSEVARGGTFFDFVTLEGDDGQVYKIRRLIAGSDVVPDIEPLRGLIYFLTKECEILRGAGR